MKNYCSTCRERYIGMDIYGEPINGKTRGKCCPDPFVVIKKAMEQYLKAGLTHDAWFNFVAEVETTLARICKYHNTPRQKVCEACGDNFVPRRTNARYCSPRCNSRIRQRKFREKQITPTS